MHPPLPGPAGWCVSCDSMGEKFGNYEILKKLAAGGMAEVFLAKQTGLGGFERLVCIKRILPHLTEQEDFITMFQDEARIAANLIHPNIAQIYDIGQVDGSLYIAMEYVRGEDLRRVYNAEVARGRAMPLEPAAQIAMYAAAGLDHAHRQTTIDGRPLGIVHRDISPQNLLITYDGHTKIVDFGVAKAANKVTETRSGVLKGKYSYMSPEQASGDPIDARTDIFALAITLYEVTTGTRLFKRENELETLHAVIECDVTPPSQIIPGYDAQLEEILMRALSYDPDERYPTSGEMERDLEKFLIGRQHPTSASSLGAYMQDLFAEKLADELLFGGAPWEENNTPADVKARHTRKVDSKPSGVAEAAHDDTEVSGPPGESTKIDEPWGDEANDVQADHWDAESKVKGWSGEKSGRREESVSRTATHGHARRDSGSVSYNPLPRTKAVMARPPLWLSMVALGGLLLGLGLGLGMILSGDRDENPGPRSGPLTLDSEPRGARVEFVGFGAFQLNEKYSGYRTPFRIEEGLRVDAPLRARFIKDGHEIIEVDVPKLEVGVVPRPLFVELQAGEEGAEWGSLMLLSNPKGAEVYVNGHKQEGATPLTDVRVRGGEMHKLEFRLKGHKPRWETRYVEPGARIFVEVNLFPGEGEAAPPAAQDALEPVVNEASPEVEADDEPSPEQADEPDEPAKRASRTTKSAPATQPKAYLNITSPMKLKVTVGSRYVGETPIKQLALDAGTHRITARSATQGFTLNHKIRLTAGRTETIDLKPRKGNLAINATPWAWVSIGKEAPAETPVRLEVYEGEYAVLFECPDGKRKKRSTRVSAGQTASVTINCRN